MPRPFLSIGHRGASGYEPENTLRSIRHALELGADGVEIDVRLSADAHPVVIHDAKLHRTTGVAGLVSRLPLSFLRTLDAGEGETIPTLAEVLALVGERERFLNIELKSPGSAIATVREIGRSLAEGHRWSPDRLVVSSFDREELRLLRHELDSQPEVARVTSIGLLLSRPALKLSRMLQALRATWLHVPRQFAGARLIARGHELGAKVLVFTVNGLAEAVQLRKAGADGIFTDYPGQPIPTESLI